MSPGAHEHSHGWDVGRLHALSKPLQLVTPSPPSYFAVPVLGKALEDAFFMQACASKWLSMSVAIAADRKEDDDGF